MRDQPEIAAFFLVALLALAISLGLVIAGVLQTRAETRCETFGFPRAELRWDWSVYCVGERHVVPLTLLEGGRR